MKQEKDHLLGYKVAMVICNGKTGQVLALGKDSRRDWKHICQSAAAQKVS
jgi:dihydrodipicolinate synthase/N-acetylneuraminate lyase